MLSLHLLGPGARAAGRSHARRPAPLLAAAADRSPAGSPDRGLAAPQVEWRSVHDAPDMNTSRIVKRPVSLAAEDPWCAGPAPGAGALYAARGVSGRSDVDDATRRPDAAGALLHAERAAALLADAIAAKQRLLIVADYDCDGATACAVGVRALRAFGAECDYLVPNRFEHGYGLTPEIVALAARARAPDLSSPSTTASPATRAWRAPMRSASTSRSPTIICPATRCRRRPASSIRTSRAATFRASPSPASA